MILLAIDPGYDKVGYAIFDKKGANNYTFITSDLVKTKRTDDMTLRLSTIYTHLEQTIKLYKVEKVIMEQLFFFKNPKTIIGVAQSQGTILTLCGNYQLPLVWLTPLQIKQAITGYGRAEKGAVAKMLPLLMGKKIETKDDDEDDAIATGLAYCSINEAMI
jgi:crossover junction endodeoxyribonuclease RuvC